MALDQHIVLKTNVLCFEFSTRCCKKKKENFKTVDFTNILLYLSKRIPFHKQSCIIRNSKSTISACVSLYSQLSGDPEPCVPHTLVAVLPCQITLYTYPDGRTGSLSSLSATDGLVTLGGDYYPADTDQIPEQGKLLPMADFTLDKAVFSKTFHRVKAFLFIQPKFSKYRFDPCMGSLRSGAQ